MGSGGKGSTSWQVRFSGFSPPTYLKLANKMKITFPNFGVFLPKVTPHPPKKKSGH